jgi:hypothetical protein
MTRPRAHIPLIELLASALADKLPQKERDDLRARKVPAGDIVRMFTPDHVTLHCWNGSDAWWNLDMRRRGADLDKKDAADTSRAAKADRLADAMADFRRRLLAKAAGEPRPVTKWPKRKLQSRNNLRKRAG